jgi:hypothetical protein
MVSVGIPSIWLDHTLLNGGCRWVTVAYLFLLANRFSFQEKERSADRLRKTGSEIVPRALSPGRAWQYALTRREKCRYKRKGSDMFR